MSDIEKVKRAYLIRKARTAQLNNMKRKGLPVPDEDLRRNNREHIPEGPRKPRRKLSSKYEKSIALLNRHLAGLDEDAVAANHTSSDIAGIGNDASDPPVKKKKKPKLLRRILPL